MCAVFLGVCFRVLCFYTVSRPGHDVTNNCNNNTTKQLNSFLCSVPFRGALSLFIVFIILSTNLRGGILDPSIKEETKREV